MRSLQTIYEDEELDFNLIENKLDLIIEKLEKLEKDTVKNSENCEKMSSHIDFIEKVYSNLKSPLDYMRYKLGFSGKEELPSIKE